MESDIARLVATSCRNSNVLRNSCPRNCRTRVKPIPSKNTLTLTGQTAIVTGAVRYRCGHGTISDASLLLPAIGFPADEQLPRSTLEVVEKELRKGEFVWRYLGEDGLDGKEAPFLVCSFWLVDALLFGNRPDDAGELFETLLKRANAHWAGDTAIRFVMVKDRKNRFPDNPAWGEGWGWALFKADRPSVNIAHNWKQDTGLGNCYGCHVPTRQTDWVYTEGYPILRSQ